jgi:hypothetical protein
MIDPTMLERLERTLHTKTPHTNWGSALVPAAMVVDLLEATSAVLRSNGALAEAGLLDGLRRSFLAARRNPMLKQEGAPAEAAMPLPAHGNRTRLSRRVPGTGRAVHG